MKAIILAGGFGTRLKKVVTDVPKPMAPVNGRPFLEILIKRLIHFDISDIVLSVGYKQEVIRNYFADGTSIGASIAYSAEGLPLGTGGAIKAAMMAFPADRYLVMNGDSFFDHDVEELLTYHQTKKAIITLALAEVADKSRYGSVEINATGVISRFAEKGAGGPGTINAGVYVIEREIMTLFPGDVCSFENDVLQKIIGKRLFGLRQQGFFIDIGVPEDYRAFCASHNVNQIVP
jgi:D-glycero-alpha-D-manno-heptose 1-phosphate guanylyltransferase